MVLESLVDVRTNATPLRLQVIPGHQVVGVVEGVRRLQTLELADGIQRLETSDSILKHGMIRGAKELRISG